LNESFHPLLMGRFFYMKAMIPVTLKHFWARFKKARRGTILDVGANIGTHSQAFSRYFEKVYSFEVSATPSRGSRQKALANEI
jgi:hypothetical protein